jgi:hypothetical protein
MADIKAGMFVGSAGTSPTASRKLSRCISSRNRCAAPAKAITTGISSQTPR